MIRKKPWNRGGKVSKSTDELVTSGLDFRIVSRHVFVIDVS